jgi:F-type H+-transporting ATPase subunit epsilon
MKLHFEITTPERVVLSTEADSVTIPAIEGEVTILPEHIPLFTRIKPGEIKFKNSNKEEFLAVTEGFLEVLNDRVTILTSFAVRDEEVEVSKVEEAKKRAEKLLSEKLGNEEIAFAQAELTKAVLSLKVARRRRSH